MYQLKKGKCVICLEETSVQDISSIVIFWKKQGMPEMDGKICENCYKQLVEHKGLWSKDGLNGLKLIM